MNPEVDLGKFFPNPQRRMLVEQFLGNISKCPVIEKVITVDTGIEQPFQRLIVFSEGAEGFPTSAEQDEVVFAKKYACRNKDEAELLGSIPLFTEPLFNEEKDFYDELQGKEVHVLWQKPPVHERD